MSNKEANNNPGLCPVKGQYSGLYCWTKARNECSSLSLSTDKIWLSEFPVMEPSFRFPLTELP